MRSLPRRIFAIILLAATTLISAAAQTRATFDVAAIHSVKPGSDRGIVKPLPGGNGYVVENMTLKSIIAVIYRVPATQITGGPAWIETAKFNIEARSGSSANVEELHEMFKNLLADRFGLKMYTEKKEGAFYELRVEKSGLKMKPDGTTPDLNIPINMTQPGVFSGVKVPMSYLCWFLSNQMRDDPQPCNRQNGPEPGLRFHIDVSARTPARTYIG